MNFKDIKFCRENRFSIGVEEESGKFFISFPVTAVGFADYEEYYEIPNEEFKNSLPILIVHLCF